MFHKHGKSKYNYVKIDYFKYSLLYATLGNSAPARILSCGFYQFFIYLAVSLDNFLFCSLHDFNLSI